MNTINQIKNFVLNICTWQTEKMDIIYPNYFHKLSIHIQDVIPGYIINWICVDNDNVWFDGIYINSDTGKTSEDKIYLKDCKINELTKVLNILKSIDLFKS